MIRKATMLEVPDISGEFRKLEKQLKKEGKAPIFAFIRQDYLERCVRAGILYYDNGVIAVIKQYKVPVKKYGIMKGDWSMPELLNTNPSNVTAIMVFMRKVLKELVQDGRLYGTIRDDNTNSVKWHLIFGYKRVADIVWSNGTLPGGVYMYDNSPKEKDLPSKWFKKR